MPSSFRHRAATCAAALAALAAFAAFAAFAPMAARAQADAVPPTFVENCVHDETMEMHAGVDSALLDDGDRRGAQAAMTARYKQLGPEFSPSAIVLWRSPVFGWIYVALQPHPSKPGKVCSIATFSAPVFEFTGDLLRKYFAGSRT